MTLCCQMIDIEICIWFELQESIAGSKYSLSFPYVTVASNRASVGESLISNVQKKLGAGSKIGQVAVSGSCSVGRHDVKRLTGVPDIEVIQCI